MPDHGLNSNAFLNLDVSLSHSSMNVPGITKLHKKSAKLIAIHNIPLPHTYIIIYCNKLNSGCCLSIDSVNVNKS